ncbi:MAG: response regulator [Nitrospiraceae bacterium]|nr:MAG: response regulator [Nitrospiraceae bacterium]
MSATNTKGRILVMDDEVFIRSMLLQALSSSGYKVYLSRHGAEAIKLFELAKKSGRPFDALIVDLKIKNGMDGSETISRLIKIDPDVKAIVSSSDPYHPAMLNHRDYGFKDILPRPFSIKELQEKVHLLIHEGEEHFN